MLRRTCMVLVMALIAFPALATSLVFIEGGQPSQAVSAPLIAFPGGQPIAIPASLWDLVPNFFETLLRLLG